MIRSLKLKNFKSAKNAVKQLEFGDITIFAGANSSGKSTVIQSILLLMQTLSSRDPSSLLLNGDLVSLGTVEDVWHNGDTRQNLTFELILRHASQKSSGFYELHFSPVEKPSDQTGVMLVHGIYAWDRDDSDEYAEYFETEMLESHAVIHNVSPEFLERWEDELSTMGYQGFSEPFGCQLRLEHFLPAEARIKVERESRELNWSTVLIDPIAHDLHESVLQERIPDEHRQFIVQAIGKLSLPALETQTVIPRWMIQGESNLSLQDYMTWYGELPALKVQQLQKYLSTHLKGVTEEYRRWFRPEVFDLLGETAYDFVSRIRYLSANRVAPRALYDLAQTNTWSEVGVDGSRVATALDEYKQKSILFWHPVHRDVRNDSLLVAVVEWLQYFGMIDELKTIDYGKLGTFLSIKPAGVDKELDLTSVGFGTSQVLPIIVQGLLTPPGGVFIVEQPEVHLHPKVQSQLAYFFFALTLARVQCVVETHSEYIVNQLRLLIAKRQDDNLRHRTRIYFASRSSDKGTFFEEVRVSQNGKIENWPKDFMDESNKLAQELLDAVLNKTE